MEDGDLTRQREAAMGTLPLMMSVPRLGKLIWGAGEAGAYDLARRGQMITINTAEPGGETPIARACTAKLTPHCR